MTGDPVATGLAASLARPGGNVTGVSILTDEVDAKQLELLKETVPGLTRVESCRTLPILSGRLDLRSSRLGHPHWV
jgi:hypothetical protein